MQLLRPDQIYVSFFKATKREPLIVLRGGRRSGKTMAHLWRFVAIAEHGSGGDCLITSDTFPNLGKVMKDFADVTGVPPEYRQKEGEYVAKYRRMIFRFRSFNRPQDAKGTRCKWLYINEMDGITKELYEMLEVGVERQIVADMNPTDEDHWSRHLQTGTNTLVTNYMHNSFLSVEQKERFQKIEEVGQFAPVGSAEYKRYSNEILGEYATLGGRVFNNLVIIDNNTFDNVECVQYLGVDFGDTTDMTALASCKFDFGKKTIFVREEFYNTRVPDSMVATKIKALRGCRALIYETATGGNTRVLNMLQDPDFTIQTIPIIKMSVYGSVAEMAEWTIKVTGANAEQEFKNYKIKEGEFTGADHIIDAVRYVFIMVVLQRLI